MCVVKDFIKLHVLVGKSFGCVDIDIERKNISILADVEGVILSTK